MLTELTITNFKNHASTHLTGLRPLNVLVGPNGSGKSSVLEAAHYIHQLGSKPPQDLFAQGSPRAPQSLARLGERSFSIHASGSTQDDTWTAKLTYNLDNSMWKESLLIGWGGEPATEAQYDPRRQLLAPPWVRQALHQSVYFRLESSQLGAPSVPDRLPPRVEFDGYGLPSAVSYLMRTDPDKHRELSQRLHAIVPSVVGLRTNPIMIPRRRRRTLRIEDRDVPFETTDTVPGDELLFDTIDGRGIAGSGQSDGTLFVLGILTALSLPTSGKLVLLDDIEAGIHPAAQRHLVRVLRDLTLQTPDLQLMMTTHSPYVLDELAPEEVLVVGRDPKQQPWVRRLSDHPHAEDALRVLTTGEFWSTEGESWDGESQT